MKDETLNGVIDLLKIAVSKLVHEATKEKLHSSNISSDNSSVRYTMFKPKFSIKEQQERHNEQSLLLYKKNNTGEHTLGKKFPNKPNAVTLEVYKNYKAINNELKSCCKDREHRHEIMLKK